MKRFAPLLAVLFVTGLATGEELYFEVPIRALEVVEGSLEELGAPERAGSEVRVGRIPLDGAGEAYVDRHTWTCFFWTPRGEEVKGVLVFPSSGREAGRKVVFRVPAPEESHAAKVGFWGAKERYYEQLLWTEVPGAAWFRHQARAARAERQALGGPAPEPSGPARWRRETDLEETFALFTGGRALSENLQLDRLLDPIAAGQEVVEIEKLQGITVRAFDWKRLLGEARPRLDPLAALIPADQHALFFPSFAALIETIDEAEAGGTPVLQLFEPRSEDARVKARYEAQLCLPLSGLARLLGPQVVAGVAFTGSDPFLRTGSDVAVLFEARSPAILTGFMATTHAAALAARPDAQKRKGESAGVRWVGVVTPCRTLSSYVATVGDALVVTNSLEQLRRIAEVGSDAKPSLASLEEYAFFRKRYALGEKGESALGLVPDGALRRWCGPRWRILDSRRTRAAAALAELQAGRLEEVVRGTARGTVETELQVPDLGPIELTAVGPASPVYGNLGFLTPIVELRADRASAEEARAYGRFRENYQRNWSQYFDPIALRLSTSPDKLAADLSVMPLILGTEYETLMEVTRGAVLPPEAGDLHPGSLLHLALGIQPQARIFRSAADFLGPMPAGLGPNPFSWLGGWAALYVDDDPFWEELFSAEDSQEFLEREYPRLPMALVVEAKSALGLAAFLVGLKGSVEASAPGMTIWETRSWKERPYVRIAAREDSLGAEIEKLAVFYRATSTTLTLTLSEELIKRAIERETAGPEQGKGPKPWLGSSLAVRAERKILDVVEALAREPYAREMEQRAWGNLPALNEWRRLFPDMDPLEVHERLWNVRLLCPGGGSYVWNERWKTMESTHFGHPAGPKTPASAFPAALKGLLSGAFGLTFEEGGLRARAEIEGERSGRR